MNSLTKYQHQLHELFRESWDEGANLIFRGQANREWRLESSANRRLREFGPQDSIEYLTTRLLRPARAEGYGFQDGRPLNDLELLAALQHHGAATCLIDFTRSFHIALWFACQDHRRDGAVFVLNCGDVDAVDTIAGERANLDIAKILVAEGATDSADDAPRGFDGRRVFCWTPPPSETRFVIQHSCFVFSRDCIPAHLCKTIVVRSDDKNGLLRSLRLYYGLEEQRIFRDFAGFARSQGVGGVSADSRTATEWFVMGKDHFQRGQFSVAIEHYDRAIQLMDPPSSTYYEQRGITHWVEREYELAIRDFGAAIELDSDNHVYYGWRGKAQRSNRQYEAAIKDYDRAIELCPANMVYYHARGNAKRSLRRYGDALDDYTKMIEVDEGALKTSLFAQAMVRKEWGEATSDDSLIEAAVQNLDDALSIERGPNHHLYFHRSLMRQALGRPEGGREDLTAAWEAVMKERNTVWAPGSREAFLEKIERSLSRLKRPGGRDRPGRQGQ